MYLCTVSTHVYLTTFCSTPGVFRLSEGTGFTSREWTSAWINWTTVAGYMFFPKACVTFLLCPLEAHFITHRAFFIKHFMHYLWFLYWTDLCLQTLQCIQCWSFLKSNVLSTNNNAKVKVLKENEKKATFLELKCGCSVSNTFNKEIYTSS